MSFEVNGLDEFQRNLLRFINEDLQKEKNKELEVISTIAKSEIQLVTPVQTGMLRRSIGYEIMDQNTSEVGTNIEYARAVNDGHRTKNGGFVKGQHFMEKGLQNAEPKIYSHLNQWLNEMLKKVGE